MHYPEKGRNLCSELVMETASSIYHLASKEEIHLVKYFSQRKAAIMISVWQQKQCFCLFTCMTWVLWINVHLMAHITQEIPHEWRVYEGTHYVSRTTQAMYIWQHTLHKQYKITNVHLAPHTAQAVKDDQCTSGSTSCTNNTRWPMYIWQHRLYKQYQMTNVYLAAHTAQAVQDD